jgi:hypothetical protein
MTIYRIFNQREIASLAAGWRSIIALAPGRNHGDRPNRSERAAGGR